MKTQSIKRQIRNGVLTACALAIILSACRPAPGNVVAAFTDDPDFGVFATHTNGEALAIATEAANGEIQSVGRVFWFSPEGETVFVANIPNFDLPAFVGIGDHYILFGNYTNDSVDLAIFAPDGTTTLVEDVQFDPTLLATPTSRSNGNTSAHLAAPMRQTSLTLEDTVRVGAGMLHIAACIINSAAAAATFAWFPIAGLACASAISHAKAILTDQEPYQEFYDLWAYAKNEMGRLRDSGLNEGQTQAIEDFGVENPTFALGGSSQEIDQGPPSIRNAYMSDDFGPGPVTTAYSDAFVFTVYIQVDNWRNNTQVQAKWFAESVDGLGPNQFLGLTSDFFGPDSFLTFWTDDYDENLGVWPRGTYRVDIYLNGALAKIVEFTVEATPEVAYGYMSYDQDGSTYADTYRSGDKIYAIFELDSAISASLDVRIEVETPSGTSLEETAQLDLEEEYQFTLRMGPVTDDWEEGFYYLTIYINDGYAQSLDFYVESSGGGDVGGGGTGGQTNFDGDYVGTACGVTAHLILNGNTISDEFGASAYITIDEFGYASDWSWNSVMGLEQYSNVRFGAGAVTGTVRVSGQTCSFTGYR